MAQAPSLPKGTRDFGPEQMAKRQYVFDTIRRQFELFGFQPLETPAMENLSVLTGKYGEEGDRLIYKILNPGDYLDEVPAEILEARDSKNLVPHIADRALRYDLTVPFARFVAMNQGQLTFPFRRYQMQTVWRADRPQKGRYREFYQCDADIIGTDSLVCEAELIALLWNVLSELGLVGIEIKLNSRKILQGMVEVAGVSNRFEEFCIALDKLDKIGQEGVEAELKEKNFPPVAVSWVGVISRSAGHDSLEMPKYLRQRLSTTDIGMSGVSEVENSIEMATKLGVPFHKIVIDPTLARGLNYYTGCIIEVKALGVRMGSISGGGRYDNLTGVFGKPGLSGVGVSFGVDRICDVLEELKLYPETLKASRSQVLLAWMEDPTGVTNTQAEALRVLAELRKAGIAAEVYPSAAKLKKQIEYAAKLGIRYLGVLGPDEVKDGKISVKDLTTSVQTSVSIEDFIKNRAVSN